MQLIKLKYFESLSDEWWISYEQFGTNDNGYSTLTGKLKASNQA